MALTLRLGIVTPIVTRLPGAHARWEETAGISEIAEVVTAAEGLGYDFCTCSEHVAVPVDVATVRGGTYWDPLSVFGYLAAVTNRIQLATFVLVLGYHHPLAIAKRYGTLDTVSGGRLVLGVGSGSLEEEFELLDAPFADRGPRADDALRALRAALSRGRPEYDGEYYAFRDLLVEPHAIRARVPIWIGGRTARSLRRAVELGDAWAPFGLRTHELGDHLARARDTAAWAARSAPLEVVLQNDRPWDPGAESERVAEQLGRMQTIGATGLAVRLVHGSLVHYVDQLAALAELAPDPVASAAMTLRIAALVKQIPAFEAMTLGADGRLVREGLELEMSAYCRRAVAQAVATAADHGGAVTIVTLGPPAADDTLREAIAWGVDRSVDCRGVLVSDPAFAGSDTLATARALAAALAQLGGFDLVLAGRNSVDADTGQVGPELAELLGLPFVTGARHLTLDDTTLDVRAEHDDGWAQVRVELPAVVSTAERLIDPCKVDPTGRAAVPADRITLLCAADLGPGPWGATASPTTVGATRVVESNRLGQVAADLPLDEQVARAVAVLTERGALDARHDRDADHGTVPPTGRGTERTVGIVVEPDRSGITRELLGAAAQLDARVVALTVGDADLDDLGGWGADHVVTWTGIAVANEEDTAAAVAEWARDATPWALLAPGTAWGREVAARVAADLGTGLTGDAIELDTNGDELIAWKPAFGGQIVAAIHCATRPQMATVRAGVLPTPTPRRHVPTHTVVPASPRSRLRIAARTRDDDLDLLADAPVVIGVGRGVDPVDYPRLDPLVAILGAELAATRKVTDQGWLPRARQIGITGRTIAPRLFVSIGASGKFNHVVGVRTAGTILAINRDPDALIVGVADVTIVGDHHDVVPALATALRAVGRT